MTGPVDQPARERAIDPAGSFIVQAPAGSGKTSLLTQRFLALLAVVEAPEAILAMTFTKKAAAEMRHRILDALAAAQSPCPDDAAPHDRTTRALARSALDRDAERQWGLLEHPARLRISTIDALCQSLVTQMPYLSRLGGQASPTEDAVPLYEAAADRLLGRLEDPSDAVADALAGVLGLMDNNRGRLRELILEMLQRRDQWLRHVVHGARGGDMAAFRADVEHTIRCLHRQALDTLRREHGHADWAALAPLWAFAREHLPDTAPESPVLSVDWQAPADWTVDNPEALPFLSALADWLLTNEGEWRKRVNKTQGFPAGRQYAESKQQVSEWLAARREDTPPDVLAAFRSLPCAPIPEAEWQLFEALAELLLNAVAELQLVFAERRQLDFIEVAQAALRALGTEDDPTEIALRKDQQISHLLVDEFQDTSHTQYRLIDTLIREWGQTPDKTLFLVGDPMQSIYRFREADVGLFLRVKHRGFANRHPSSAHRPDFLELSANFRSRAGIVDWVNARFAEVFPVHEDVARGAIPYTPSTATLPEDPDGPAVQWHLSAEGDGTDEGERIAACIAAIPPAERDVAVLVRNRKHAQPTVAALRRHGIAFQGVNMDPLRDKQVTADLISLTRALLHPADGIAWLACLRAPWVGLRLTELEDLMAPPGDAIVWERLQHADWQAGLDQECRARVQRFIAVMGAARAARGRQSLARRVERAWTGLGGPVAVTEATAVDDARAFLELLASLPEDEDDVLGRLEAALDRLFAAPDPAGERVRIMTIHQAKGLEFDTVFLPGLERTPPGDGERLLHWQELSLPDGEEGTDDVDGLLLAPVDEADETSGLFEYLRDFEKAKADYEARRLLYVAVTRARRRLHLLGRVKMRTAAGEDGETAEPGSPHRRSFLAYLWTDAQRHLDPETTTGGAGYGDTDTAPVYRVAALREGWWLPEAPPVPRAARPAFEVLQPWSPDPHRAPWREAGSLTHAYLEAIHRTGLAEWGAARVDALAPVMREQLQRQGVADRRREAAARRVLRALHETLNDECGRWLLRNDHEDSQAELELYRLEPDATSSHVIDRTFVADGTRWIVDYKITEPAKQQSRADFLDEQQALYREQLERYATLFARREDRPIRLMLYFPLIGAERSWAFEPSAVAALSDDR